MTRQEFEDNISNLDELYDFCSEHDIYEFFDDRYIRDEDGLQEYISDYFINELFSNYSWQEIRDYLNDLNDIYNSYYWYCVEDFCPTGVSSNGRVYEEIKDEVFDYAINHGLFDDEDDEEVEVDRTVYEVNRRIGHDANETQVKWNCEIKDEEEVYEEPQDDISLVLCF